MKRRALSFIGILCILMMLFTTMPIAVSAASEKDIIVNNEYECIWGYYRVSKSNYDIWYISELGNWTGKRDVFSLGPKNPDAAWMTVGKNVGTISGEMNRITVDYGLSYDREKYVHDTGNDKITYYPSIIEDRESVEGKTHDFVWYFFEVEATGCWYIVNDNEVRRFDNGGQKDYEWTEIDISGYKPSFNIRNGKKYVSFENKSNTPPRLTGYTSMPSKIPYEERYDIEGTILSDSPITKVTINVFKRDGSWKDQQSVYPNSYTYNLSGINEDLHFARYPAGEMEIQIWAVNACGAYPLIGKYSGNQQIHGEFFTIVDNANSGKQIADVAYNERGYQGTKGDGTGAGDYTKYGVFTGTNGQQWCASFVSWCVNQSGLSTRIVPKTANCNEMKNNSNSYNVWNYNSIYNLKKNDIIFFSSDGGQDSHHVGIVYSVSNNKITLVEGNTGEDIVKVNTYTVIDLSTGEIRNGKDNWKHFCGYISVNQ